MSLNNLSATNASGALFDAGDFVQNKRVVSNNQILYYTDLVSGVKCGFVWKGTLPHIISTNDPNTDGGISDTAWMPIIYSGLKEKLGSEGITLNWSAHLPTVEVAYGLQKNSLNVWKVGHLASSSDYWLYSDGTVWNGTGTLGNTPQSSSGFEQITPNFNASIKTYAITATDGQTTFNIPFTFSTVNVFVNGSLQLPGINYTINGSSIVFSTELEQGDIVYVFLGNPNISTNDKLNRIYTSTAMQGQTELQVPYDFSTAIVYINGVLQNPSSAYYIGADKTITFSEELYQDDEIVVMLGDVVVNSDDYVLKDELLSNNGASIIRTNNSSTVQDALTELTDISNDIISHDPSKGSSIINYSTFIGVNFSISDYLNNGYILVNSREQLLSAVNYVNTVLKKPTEIRLARIFSPWTAAQTDIDIAWVSLVGEGGYCYIDATGIPNVEGNYWLRVYNSGASNINNLGNIYTDKLSGIFTIGPGQTSLVDAILYHAPSGSSSSFTTKNLGTMNFRTGDSYRNNAYIIKHWGRSISRCTNHIWMPSGYSNYGEAIEYFASTISTSNGVGIKNDNPNGAIRFHGGSLDYMGRIAVASAGRIELDNTHIEFNNNSNKLFDSPFETINAETSEIVINGGIILGYVSPLPEAVTTIFKCGSNTNGITINNVQLMNLTLFNPLSTINSGSSKFITNNISVIDGNGNPRVPFMKDDTQNLLYDPNFTQNSIVDWYISSDTGALVSRTEGVNLKLEKDTTVFRGTGPASMKVTKAFGIGSASEIQVRVPINSNTLTTYEMYFFGNISGSIFVNAYYVSSIYNTNIGIPVTARSVQVGPTRTITASQMTDWVRVSQQQQRNYTPEWATHLVIRVQLSSISAGSFNIDDVKVTQL